MKNSLLTILFILIVFAKLNAQDVLSADLSWTVTELNDLKSNAKSSYQCVFKTNGKKTIAWEQKGGTTIFTIESVGGSWADFNKVGQVVYNVNTDGTRGTLTFEKTPTGNMITMDLLQAPDDHLRHQFSVTQVSKTN